MLRGLLIDAATADCSPCSDSSGGRCGRPHRTPRRGCGEVPPRRGRTPRWRIRTPSRSDWPRSDGGAPARRRPASSDATSHSAIAGVARRFIRTVTSSRLTPLASTSRRRRATIFSSPGCIIQTPMTSASPSDRVPIEGSPARSALTASFARQAFRRRIPRDPDVRHVVGDFRHEDLGLDAGHASPRRRGSSRRARRRSAARPRDRRRGIVRAPPACRASLPC